MLWIDFTSFSSNWTVSWEYQKMWSCLELPQICIYKSQNMCFLAYFLRECLWCYIQGNCWDLTYLVCKLYMLISYAFCCSAVEQFKSSCEAWTGSQHYNKKCMKLTSIIIFPIFFFFLEECRWCCNKGIVQVSRS